MVPDDQGPRPGGQTSVPQLGSAMRAAREGRGIGLREMARKLHLSAHSNLSEYESGKRVPSEDIVSGYEQILGLSQGALLKILEAVLDETGRVSRRPGMRIPLAADSIASWEGRRGNSDVDKPMPNRRRRTILVAVGIVVILLGGGVAAWILLHRSGDSSSSTQAAPYPDDSDPQVTGCRDDATVIDDVDVYDPPGHLVGTLELRASARCGMNWGRFSPTVGLSQSPTLTLVIDVRRPADNRNSPFSVTYDGQAAYGNMLMSRLECVYTTLTLERQGNRSPTFQTACLEAPTRR